MKFFNIFELLKRSSSMPNWPRLQPTLILCILFGAPVHATNAQAIDFKFLSGGGGGSDPQKQRIARGSGDYICLSVTPSATPKGSAALFTLWSRIPEPYSRIVRFTVDTGRYTGLFSSYAVVSQSYGLKITPAKLEPHAFLPSINPAYAIDIRSASPPNTPLGDEDPLGFRPGAFIVVSATLGSGKSFADVMAALRQGLTSGTEATGLRIGVIAEHLNGKRPIRGVTIMDDGGFVIRGMSTRCTMQ